MDSPTPSSWANSSRTCRTEAEGASARPRRPEARLPAAASPRAAPTPQPQPRTHRWRRIEPDVPPRLLQESRQSVPGGLGSSGPARQPRAQVRAPLGPGPCPGLVWASPTLTFCTPEEVLCCLAVPHHLGPVVPSVSGCTWEDGMWVQGPPRSRRWVGVTAASRHVEANRGCVSAPGGPQRCQ